MGGKRVEPTGHYELRDHPTIKELVNVHWHPNGGHPDPRPLLTLGPAAIPLLAEALAEWELEHQVPPPRRETDTRGLRVVGEDGEI